MTVARPALYVLVLISIVLAAAIHKLRTDGIFACPAAYGSDRFLAYCDASDYGEYEHGSFWFGLDRDAQRYVRNADVIFLGNSRMEMAFSTDATERWFSSIDANYYLLGFAYFENASFEGPLLARLNPLARVYVINVDRFFVNQQTRPAETLMRDRGALTRYEEKRSWQILHKRLCVELPGLCGHDYSVFRSRSSGAWHIAGFGKFPAGAVADLDEGDRDQWPRFTAIGSQFLGRLPVDRDCVLLTLVPSGATRKAEALSIASALGYELLAPQVDGLRTYDGSHLDPPSAQRWAAAFYEAAGPRIRRCLAASAHAD